MKNKLPYLLEIAGEDPAEDRDGEGVMKGLANGIAVWEGVG